MGCADSKPGGGVLADAPVRNLGTQDPPSSTPLPEQAGDNGPVIATLLQQNQDMMRVFLLSQAATAAQPLAPSTTTAAPVVVAPSDGGGGEVDDGEECSLASRSAAPTVLPSSLTALSFSIEDGLLGSDSGAEEKTVVLALDAVSYAGS